MKSFIEINKRLGQGADEGSEEGDKGGGRFKGGQALAQAQTGREGVDAGGGTRTNRSVPPLQVQDTLVASDDKRCEGLLSCL